MKKPIVWGVHMPLKLGTAPVEQSYAAIGWPEVGDLGAIPQNREAFKKRVAQTFHHQAAEGLANLLSIRAFRCASTQVHGVSREGHAGFR